MENEDIFSSLLLELRRGVLTISVLSQLKEKEYGYSLVQKLSGQGIEIDAGTLYPMLRRLEKQGVLSSNWTLDEARPRRYYYLNEQGKKILEDLKKEWYLMCNVLNKQLEEEG